LAREGVEVELKARNVTVSRFEVLTTTESEGAIDLDVVVDCSSGTYIRALARDLGSALGVGGHLTALRRTHVGPFDVARAASIDDLAGGPSLSPAEVASAVLGRVDVTDDEARDLRHGKRLSGAGTRMAGDTAAAIEPSGALVGILERRGADLKSGMNMPTAPGEAS
ncbi:MAG TPA: tRNA pseudouridine(55) synthase TruB, partial [Microbacterium sp.]|nr:tRNA pseudouridine(55) synthase TruB [Microbacterium sp.]